MQNCVFCQIADGREHAYKIWEDDNFMAVLDIFPKITGQVVLFSKPHLPSYVFGLDNGQISDFFIAAKKASEVMNQAFGTTRVAQRMEGLEVDHAHIKLYPVYSAEDYMRDANNPPKRESKETMEMLFNKFQKGR